MVEITLRTDAGEFTTDSIKEARRMERKAKAEASKKAKVDSVNGELAIMRAKANGYDFLARAAMGKEKPRGWTYHPVGSSYSPCRQIDSESTLSRRTYEIDAEQGRARFDCWNDSMRLLGTIENGAGFCKAIAVEIRDHDTGEWAESCMAVGVSADQIRFEPMPGISKDSFARAQ